MENTGPLRLVVASSARGRQAVDALIRFRKVWYSGFQIRIDEECGIACMAIDFSGNFVGHQLVRERLARRRRNLSCRYSNSSS